MIVLNAGSRSHRRRVRWAGSIGHDCIPRTMPDRAALTALLVTYADGDYDQGECEGIADAILAAGWRACLHENSSGFSNDEGPWRMQCADCGQRWTQQTSPASEHEHEWIDPRDLIVPPDICVVCHEWKDQQ